MTLSYSKLPPASAARRVVCPGSRVLEEKYTIDKDSPSAIEGKLAHEIAAACIRNPYDSIRDSYSNYTNEMIDGAILYKTEIFNYLHNTNTHHSALRIEEILDISIIHPECSGVPDCWFFKEGVLYLFEYKFGHTYVEVFENWQLIEYAAGISNLLEACNEVEFVIIQPRGFHRNGQVRRWRVSISTLQPLFKRLRETEELAFQDIAICVASDQCNQCQARHVCPTLQQAALRAVDATYLNIPHNLNAVDLGYQMRYLTQALHLIEARLTGLKEETEIRIKRGEMVPGYMLDSQFERMQWRVDAKEIIALGEMLDINLAKSQTVVTPKQALKLGVPKELLDTYVEFVPSKMRLVEIKDELSRKLFNNSMELSHDSN